jgi:hypothetical protein
MSNKSTHSRSRQNRTRQGRPTGGQFASRDHGDAEVNLTPSASHRVFQADLDRFNKMFDELDAFVFEDDKIVGIDPEKAPADVLGAYQRLTSYGYANGLV